MTFHDRRPPTRRPRRANTLKDLPRLLGIAEPAHEESRRDRLLAKARRMSDTLPNARRNYFNIQVANLFLRAFGVTLIANDRVFHIWEDWPGAVGAAWLDEGVGVATGACGCRCRPRHRRSTGGRETSLRAIADGLNERGIPTARGNGEWSAVQVQRVLARL